MRESLAARPTVWSGSPLAPCWSSNSSDILSPASSAYRWLVVMAGLDRYEPRQGIIWHENFGDHRVLVACRRRLSAARRGPATAAIRAARLRGAQAPPPPHWPSAR